MGFWGMIQNTFEKLGEDKSWIVGFVSAIPAMLLSAKGWSMIHINLSVMFGFVLVAEWIVGTRLARKSNTRSSEIAIDSLIRDVVIILLIAACYFVDEIFDTGCLVFSIVTVAFIYHNLYSLMANVVLLNWGKHFPVAEWSLFYKYFTKWLYKWLGHELEVKREKYFPDNNEEK